MSLGFPTLILCLLVSTAAAAEPFLEKVDLFESGKESYALYRIPGVAVTKKGTVLVWCEARRNARGDWGPIDVMLRRSTDGGKTWAPRRRIVHIEGELPVNPLAAAQKLDRPGDNTANEGGVNFDREHDLLAHQATEPADQPILYTLIHWNRRSHFRMSDTPMFVHQTPILINHIFHDSQSPPSHQEASKVHCQRVYPLQVLT